jgi:hypothetical protein
MFCTFNTFYLNVPARTLFEASKQTIKVVRACTSLVQTIYLDLGACTYLITDLITDLGTCTYLITDLGMCTYLITDPNRP